MFRRRTNGAPAVAETDETVQPTATQIRQAGKGRPTPKRSEVERRRRQPVAAQPTDRKASAAKRRTDYARRRAAANRGEEWALRPADRGPVRALARDYIDSRRVILSEYVLIGLFIAILAVFGLGAARNSLVILGLEFGIIGLVTVESLYHGRKVIKLVRERLPGENTRGLGWYIAKRAMRLRMTREPQARVGRGAAI